MLNQTQSHPLHPDQSLVTVRTLVGFPGMPVQMYLRNKSFRAGYGGVYCLVMSNGSNPQLDYRQDGRPQDESEVHLPLCQRRLLGQQKEALQDPPADDAKAKECRP